MQDAVVEAERDAVAVRAGARRGALTGHTSGLAAGFVQANVAIVPAAFAEEFEAYCRANSQACPLLAVSEPGDPALPQLGRGIDIRTDLPRYRVFRNGSLAGEVADVRDIWADDLVAFAIGCSFTFERALMRGGIPLRHVEQGRNVAMYRSSIETVAAGPFGGGMVVSMRPVLAADAERASEITGRFPAQHGRAVHIGDPGAIGVGALERPDFGDAVEVRAGEVPVFWACGVTSQVALERAGLPFFIAHAPGCMLVTDLRHEDA